LVVLLAVAVTLLVRAHRHRTAARDAAAETERRLSVVLATGRDGLLVHDTAGTVLVVNDAMSRLLGAPAQDVVGRPVAELPVAWVSETGQRLAPGTVLARRTHVGPGDPAPYVVGAVPATGAPMRWVQVTTHAVPAVDGGHELVTTFADQTGPREIRAALARSEK